MKKFLLIALIATCSAIANAQYGYFIKSSATLTGNNTASDTLWIDQADVYRVTSLSSGGSQLQYLQSGAQKSVNVREQIGDSAWTFASFSFTVTTNDTLYDITVAGVSITDTVPKAGTATLTAAAIADSINALTSSPNYSATSLGAVVTITPTADSTATPNGRAVVVSSAGTVTPSNGILSGGFYRRNLLSVFGIDENTLFPVTIGGVENALNGQWVSEMTGNAPVNLYYNKGPNQTFKLVGYNRQEIADLVNALPIP